MRFALLVLALLSLASSASAQRARTRSTPSVSTEVQERDARAQALYREGVAAFDARQFVAARDFFERAHALSGRVELLYNIALCADRLQRTGEAMRLYEEYLTRAPEGEQHEAASRRLQEFYAAHHAEEERRAAPPTTSAISRCPEGYVRREDACVLPPAVHQLGVGSIVGGSLLFAAGWSIQIGITVLAGSGAWREPDRQSAFNAWGYVPVVGSLVQLGYLSNSLQSEAWPYTLGIGEALMQIVGIVMIIQGIMGEEVQPLRRAHAVRWLGDGVQIAF